MHPEEIKDIFISYRNDNVGNNFGRRLKDDLESEGFGVYYNPDELGSEHFPDRLRRAILDCQDFLLIVSQDCLERLIRNDKVDWVREELIFAHENNKHIIPLMMEGVSFPKDSDDFPEKIRFLASIDGLPMPEEYKRSPIRELQAHLRSKPEKGEVYRHFYNSNPKYNVLDDYQETLKKAKENDPEAMLYLANMYYYGMADESNGSERNFREAFNWYKKTAETGGELADIAKKMMGHMYYAGSAPQEGQSYEKCFEIDREIAGHNTGALSHMAYMLSIGSGCEFDYDTMIDAYKKAAECGDITAKKGLAELYLRYGQFREAAAIYEQIYAKNPQVAVELGRLYVKGVLTSPPKPDYKNAAFYFFHAMQDENCGALPYYELGKLYFNPTGGFPKDFERAQSLFKKAADLGHADAQYILGYMYEYGHFEKSIKKAIYYHELALKGGVLNSAMDLANLYQQNECKNYHKAFQYAKLGAERGLSGAAIIYSTLLLLGRGCEPDIDEAYRYCKYAVDYGNEQAVVLLRKIEKVMEEQYVRLKTK